MKTQTITIEVPITDETLYVHVITTTGKMQMNKKSPESKVNRYSFMRVDDGRFVRYHALEHDGKEIYKGIEI